MSAIANFQQAEPTEFASCQMSREVAHELNNIFTIIQGYSDRLLVKHGENPALNRELRAIAENTRRAVAVVREAAPPKVAGVLIG